VAGTVIVSVTFVEVVTLDCVLQLVPGIAGRIQSWETVYVKVTVILEVSVVILVLLLGVVIELQPPPPEEHMQLGWQEGSPDRVGGIVSVPNRSELLVLYLRPDILGAPLGSKLKDPPGGQFLGGGGGGL
jgi:hypothetical protein